MSRKLKWYLMVLILMIGSSDSNLFWLSEEAHPADWLSFDVLAQQNTKPLHGMILFDERTSLQQERNGCCTHTSVSQSGLLRLDLHPVIVGAGDSPCCTHAFEYQPDQSGHASSQGKGVDSPVKDLPDGPASGVPEPVGRLRVTTSRSGERVLPSEILWTRARRTARVDSQ